MALSRRQLYGLIHKGSKKLFGDERALYEDWLWSQTQTGERGGRPISCTDLAFEALARLVDVLRDAGALDGPARGGRGDGATRPTPRQWRALAALVRARGWEGLEDARLQKLCHRTCRVSSTRFLTRASMTDLITGLERWEAQGRGA